MKTRTSVAPRPTHLSESEWYRRIEELSSGCKSVEVFHFQGLYFAGSIIEPAQPAKINKDTKAKADKKALFVFVFSLLCFSIVFYLFIRRLAKGRNFTNFDKF